MATAAYIVAGLALVGALACWVVAAVSYFRTLGAMSRDPQQRGLMGRAVFGWMFTTRHLQGEAAGHAAVVNKVIVAFLACVIVGAAAISVATNLARVSH
jgi:hypothetical protein